MKFLRSICKNGNSLMVTLPPQVLDWFRWRGGDVILLEVLDRDQLIVRRPRDVDDLRAQAQAVTLDPTLPGVR